MHQKIARARMMYIAGESFARKSEKIKEQPRVTRSKPPGVKYTVMDVAILGVGSGVFWREHYIHELEEKIEISRQRVVSIYL